MCIASVCCRDDWSEQCVIQSCSESHCFFRWGPWSASCLAWSWDAMGRYIFADPLPEFREKKGSGSFMLKQGTSTADWTSSEPSQQRGSQSPGFFRVSSASFVCLYPVSSTQEPYRWSWNDPDGMKQNWICWISTSHAFGYSQRLLFHAHDEELRRRADPFGKKQVYRTCKNWRQIDSFFLAG